METNKTIEINFTEIKPVDLTGAIVPAASNLHEQICNILYMKTGSIRVSDTVRELYYGRSVDADEQTLEELVFESNGCLKPIVQTAVLTYLSEKLNKLKQQDNEKEQENSN